MTNLWKRSLAMLLTLTMVFGMLPVSAFATETEPVVTEETSAVELLTAEVTEPAEPVEEATTPVTEAAVEEPAAPAAEEVVEEPTVPAAQEPAEEPTTPATEEVVEEPTAPAVEEPQENVAERASDSAAENVVEAPAETEETEPETDEIRMESAIVAVPSGEYPEEEELFAGYADHVWYGTEIAMFGTSAREQLNADTQAVYDALVPILKKIASGERASALIKVGKTLGEGYEADAEVSFDTAEFDFYVMLDALLADMPYDLYWYDKVTGTAWSTVSAGSETLHYFYFAVSGNYDDGTYETFTFQDEDGNKFQEDFYYTADTSLTGAVTDTVTKAQKVVDDIAVDAKTDYDKLLAYKNWICDAVSYNHDAAAKNNFSEASDPWQVIYVFDEKEETMVVCEGYSKAFQFLCDLTDFSEDANGDENVTCYSVTGNLVGVGAHMWNIVDIEGSHYLADITNSDADTVGDDGSLFLVGTALNSDGTYGFTTGDTTTSFTYDTETKSLWSGSNILTLATTNYVPSTEETEEPETSGEMTQAEFAAELAENAGTDYVMSKSVTITEDMTINMATEEVPYNHSVKVPSGVTLTVANGATLTMETNLLVDGGTVIVEEGSCLAIGSADCWSMMYIWSGVLNVAEETGLDRTYGRLTVEHGADYTIPSWISTDSINAQAYIIEPDQLQSALALTQYAFIDIYVQCDLTVAENITLAKNQCLVLQPECTMTIEEDITVTVAVGATLFAAENVVINNNGRIVCYGEFQNYGTLNGNAIENSSASEMSQADFAAAVAAAAEAKTVYNLTSNVTLTSDMTIDCNVIVEEGASLTVAEDAKLTVKNYPDGDFAQLSVNGEMLVQSGATLYIIHDSLVHAYFGNVTIEEGAILISENYDGTITTGTDDDIWFNRTQGGTVTGVADELLGIEFYPESAADLEAALATTGYAHVHVYMKSDIVLDRDITIPANASLDVSEGSTLTVPAGFTLTNNSNINIQDNNRLEILKDATLVNNGDISVGDYAQLVIRGTLTDNGNIYGSIVWGEMSHEDLRDVLKTCETNGTSWVHESETTLETAVDDGVLQIAMGEGPAFYLAEGGVIRVPSGTTLKVYNPLILIGGKIIVEAGGTLDAGEGHMEVQSGTIYVEVGGNVVDNGHIQGKVTYADDTDPYLSSTWLDNNNGQGWYLPEDNVPNEVNGLMAMGDHWQIFFLNTWDETNLVWNAKPVIPTESNEFMTITRIVDMEGQTIREDQDSAYSEYFVYVNVYGTLDEQNVYLYADGYTFPIEIYRRPAGFFRTTEFSMDSFIEHHEFILDTNATDNSIYWLVRDPANYDVVSMNVGWYPWNGEDFSGYITGETLIDLDDSQSTKGIYKFTVDPGFVNYVQYDYKNFELQVDMVLDHNGDNEIHEEPCGDGVWINPPELLDPAANLGINNCNYLIYEDGAVFRDYWDGDQRVREKSALPGGVSYVLENNQLLLDNANLQRLELTHLNCWEDEEGYHEEPWLPSENLTITLVGSNTISNDTECAVAIRNGTNVTINGNGSLHLLATNSSGNVNDDGNCYAYPTVALDEESILTVTGNAQVTAEVAGSGFHGEKPAQMEAINGHSNGTLTLSGSATLNIVTPEGTRTLDESKESYGGARGIVGTNIVVSDSATLNTGSIYLWDGVDFTMDGGTVNLDPLGEIFYNSNRDVYYVWNLGVYMESEESTFTLNDGVINVNVAPKEADSAYAYSLFMGMDIEKGNVYINGGKLNINGAQDGFGIGVECGWNEDGPIADEPAGNLYMNGGIINIYGTEGWMHQGFYVAPYAKAELNGGTINADYSDNSLEGNVIWDGTEFNGTVAAIRTSGPGEFTMESGEINMTGAEYEFDGEIIQGNAAFEANGSGKILGGSINITNGVFRNKMNIGIEGGEITINNEWDELPGIENNLYLPISGGKVDITANGTAIVNKGTLHQMGGRITAKNTSDVAAELPVLHSTGRVLMNDGTMDLSGGYFGIIQNYDFALAADEETGNESVLFVGAINDGQVPTLNIHDTKMGIYGSAPVDINWNASVTIDAEGTPTSEGRDWPTAIFIDKVTAEGSDVNVSSLHIGNSVVNLTSQDTADTDLMSKGIVAWYSPVTIEGTTDESGTYYAPNVTIDAEMAVYSVSDALETTNLTIDENISILSRSTGKTLTVTSRDFTDTEATGDYLHTLMEDENTYAGSVKLGITSEVNSIDALKALMTYHEETGRWRLEQSVEITDSFALTGIIVDVINGGELIVKNGAVLTIPEDSHLIAQSGGTITVEAGGRIENYGIFASDCGKIYVSDGLNEDGTVYAGYTHNSDEAVLNCHYRDGVMSVMEGISKDMITLMCDDPEWTTDKIHAVWGIEGLSEYKRVEVNVCNDLELAYNMVIPAGIDVYVNDAVMTVPEGLILTVKGNLTGTNYANIVINGTLNAPDQGTLWINDAATVDLNGTMTAYGAIHVGIWKEPDTEEPGVLNINGTLNNYGYLNICEEAENTYGVVNVFGTLNNLIDAEKEEEGFIELHGTLNVQQNGSLNTASTLYDYGKLNVNQGGKLDNNTGDFRVYETGVLTVGGTMNTAPQSQLNMLGTMTVNGTFNHVGQMVVTGVLDVYGTLVNDGSIRMYNTTSKVTTYEGASLVNNMSISNNDRNAVLTLAEGTYTHGSHSYNGQTEPAELVQAFFDGGAVSQINGAPEGTLSLMYEGSNAESVLDCSETFNLSNGYYYSCFLRVVAPMTFPAGKELNLLPNSYLVVMNNGSNYTGSLTVEGSIFNQGAIRIFAANVTIAEGGSILNENELTVSGTAYGNTTPPTFTVAGLLQNEYTGTAKLDAVTLSKIGSGVIQNNLKGDQLGSISGVPIADQTLFCDITEGTQERLQEVISITKDGGYNSGYFFISQDMHISSNMVIPEGIAISVQSGATLTIDSGVILQLDSTINVDVGGKLDVYGTLGIGGTVDVRGEMYVDTYGSVGLGVAAQVNVMESGNLSISGHFGVDGGTLNILGTYDNYGTISVTWTESGVGAANGVDLSQATLWMPINATFPNHDEEDIAVMLAYAQQNGFGKTQLHIVKDFTFANDFTVPENMTLSIGSYQDDTTYSATTVTVGKSLTVNGKVEVATGSKLVIAEGATLTNAGEYVDVYGTLENNGVLYADSGYVSIMNYVHGENAEVYQESYDEDYASISGVDLNLITMIYRGTDEEQLLNFFNAMSWGFSKGEVYINGPMTMSNNWYAEPADYENIDNFDVDVYIGEGAVLTVPEINDTLSTNTSIYVQDGGCVNVTGALFVHADMLIMDGGTVTVDGTMRGGTIYVYEGGKLIVNGNWDGYNPINYGGTIQGECFALTQAKLVTLMAQTMDAGHSQLIMRSSLELEDDMTIDCNLVVVGEGYVLTVPKDVTLTVNGTLQIQQGAKLDVQGKLVNNGSVVISGEGTQMVNTGTVDDYNGIHTIMNGEIVNNGTWNTFYGTCGDSANWNLKDGVLTISGTGAMLDYAKDSAPWAAFADQITSVKIGTGITAIGANAFSNVDKDKVTSILVPRAVESVGEGAFAAGVTLKVYHNSAAENYAEDNGNDIAYIHELDPDTGECVYGDFGLQSALESAETTQEKVDVLKDTDTESLKDQIEAEMSSETGTSDTMELIAELEQEVLEDESTNLTVSTTVDSTSEVITSTFQNASDVAIVGAALNAEEGVNKVELVISDAENTTSADLGEEYDAENAVLFSMTLEGVTDSENLDVPVKITLPVPENISDPSKMKILHYHGDEVEEVAYTLSEDQKTVTFVLSSFSDFAFVTELDEDPAQYGTLTSYAKSLLFEDIIRVRYYFNYEGDYTNDYLVENGGILIWTSERENYEPGTEDYKVEGFSIYTDKTGTHFHATAEGIPAKQWGEQQYACAYVKNADGSYTYSEVSSYSPLTYATNMLAKSTTKETLKTLLVAMLNYGSAAQTNFKYNTDNLMNSGLTVEQQSWTWDESLLITKLEVDESKIGFDVDENISYYAWSLLYEGAIGMRMYNSIATDLVNSAQEMGILYWNEDAYTNGVLTPENASGKVVDLTYYSGNYYHGTIEGTPAKNLGDTCFACAYVVDNDGNVHYGEVRSYSAHTYARNQIAGNKTEALKNLCKTMVIYSDAAAKHFG